MNTTKTNTPPAPAAGSPTVALSIRQPWAWLILHAGKDIENRTWSRRFAGRVLIHASKGMTKAEYRDAVNFAAHPRRLGAEAHWWIPNFDDLERGGIVGEVEILGYANNCCSPWFEGPWGLLLRNPKPLPFIPCRGALGFFRPQFPTENAERSGGGQ